VDDAVEKRSVTYEVKQWIEYGKTWDSLHREKLAKPGVVVEVEMRKSVMNDKTEINQYLIGDINLASGICGCCLTLNGLETVIRYGWFVAPSSTP
jgi:hypothetical protein